MTGAFAIDGISYPSFSDGEYAAPASEASLQELAATNANWVSIVPTKSTTTITSSDIHATSQTETDANVVQAITEAHALGLSVMLKPHVDSLDGQWRGDFAPTDVNAWFANYEADILDYAKIAQANHVEMLCIGCEFDSLTGPAYQSQWNNIISAVRAVYSGPITYASDWIAAKNVSFWNNVDYIGVDAYNPLSTQPDPTVAQLETAWNTVSSNSWVAGNANNMSPVDFYHSLSTTYGKPLIFTEIGYQSVAGAAENPGASMTGTVDFQEQANAYQAFFDVWSQQSSWMKGAFLWDWVPQTHPETLPNVGWGDYTPQDKPAEQIVTQWYGGTATPSPSPAPTPSPTGSLPLSGAPTNWITGTAGNDVLTGTASNDYFNGAGGNDTFIGGKGDDTYIVNHPTDQVVENPNEGVDTVLSWSNSYTLPANVENLILEGNWGLVGTGNSGNNIIIGGTGNDTIDGAGGHDILTGGGGNDTFVMTKGYGNAEITDFHGGAGASDVVDLNNYGFSSFAQVEAAMSTVGANVVLALGDGHTLTFDGVGIGQFAADDFVLSGATPSPSPAPAPAPTPTPTTLPDPFPLPVSGAPTHTITGTASSSSVTGTSGNDLLIDNGVDTMTGGTGDDTYAVSHSNDKIVEKSGGGTDTVDSTASSFTLPSNVENLVLESSSAQVGKGNSANNIITAGTGADTMTGNGGHDMFVFSSAADHADVITDFKSGDLLDLRPLMQAIGYTGTDPVADQVLQFAKSGSDTTITLHTATDTHTLVTLQHILPTALHAGTDYVWH